MLKDWIKQKLPDKVIVETGIERYVHKDWDVPPAPEAVVRAGLAATIEEAVAAIPHNKQWWGGSRSHVELNGLESMFGSAWPTAPLIFGAKPTALAKLREANRPMVNDGGQQVQQNLGFDSIFDDWAARGLIK